MKSRRAVLYVPGDDFHKIQKACTLDSDCVCLDMEDGVASNRKAEARSATAAALSDLDFNRSERLARINPVGSGLEIEDLQAVLPAIPDGIVIPKVEHSNQVSLVSEVISRFETQYGLPRNKIGLIVIVESALGILKSKRDCRC